MAFYRVETDLPRFHAPQTLLLVQPRATMGMEWQDLYGRDDRFFKGVLNEVIALCGFSHVGTMDYRIGFDKGGALFTIEEYKQCGGEISFPRYKGLLSPTECPKCQRRIEFYNSHSIKVVQTTLFFLALKQVFPALLTCNFLNLTFDLTVAQEFFGDAGPGLISLASDMLSGNNRLHDLGFTLAYGLDASDDQEFARLTKWVRVLVYKWAKIIRTAIDDQKFFALGPKSIR